MNRAKSVIEYYVLCNKLKDVVRTGWINWRVDCKRVESIAEHVYGTLMLAIFMKSEYEYDIDIQKVILMLSGMTTILLTMLLSSKMQPGFV